MSPERRNALVTGAASGLGRAMAVRLSDEATMTAEHVAERAVRAMRKKRLYVMAPRSARWRWYLKRLAPQAFMRGVSRAVYRQIVTIHS